MIARNESIPAKPVRPAVERHGNCHNLAKLRQAHHSVLASPESTSVVARAGPSVAGTIAKIPSSLKVRSLVFVQWRPRRNGCRRSSPSPVANERHASSHHSLIQTRFGQDATGGLRSENVAFVHRKRSPSQTGTRGRATSLAPSSTPFQVRDDGPHAANLTFSFDGRE